jgi:hypothetical protein
MKPYDSSKYNNQRPNVGVTVALFIYKDKELKTLVYKRNENSEEFPNMIALPNLFFQRELHKTSEETATEALKQKTSVQSPYLEQLHTYTGNYIDPNRITTVNIGYFALTTEKDIKKVEEEHFESHWHSVKDLIENYDLAFNHKEVLKDAFERVKSKAEYTPLTCHLLGEHFTIKEFKELTEYLIEEKLDNSRFRDRIKKTDILIQVDGKYKKAANRPAQIYILNTKYKGLFYPKSLTKPS